MKEEVGLYMKKIFSEVEFDDLEKGSWIIRIVTKRKRVVFISVTYQHNMHALSHNVLSNRPFLDKKSCEINTRWKKKYMPN